MNRLLTRIVDHFHFVALARPNDEPFFADVIGRKRGGEARFDLLADQVHAGFLIKARSAVVNTAADSRESSGSQPGRAHASQQPAGLLLDLEFQGLLCSTVTLRWPRDASSDGQANFETNAVGSGLDDWQVNGSKGPAFAGVDVGDQLTFREMANAFLDMIQSFSCKCRADFPPALAIRSAFGPA